MGAGDSSIGRDALAAAPSRMPDFRSAKGLASKGPEAVGSRVRTARRA